jgi:hypothetical protein
MPRSCGAGRANGRERLAVAARRRAQLGAPIFGAEPEISSCRFEERLECVGFIRFGVDAPSWLLP